MAYLAVGLTTGSDEDDSKLEMEIEPNIMPVRSGRTEPNRTHIV